MAYKEPKYTPFHVIASIIEKHVKTEADSELRNFSEDLKGRLVRGIYKQSFESFKTYPLTEEWKKAKLRLHYDLRVMIAKGEYVKSIRVVKIRQAKYEIGVPKNKRVKRSDGSDAGITMETLAAIHEKGSAKANIPPRPHWSVIRNQAQKEAPSVANKIARKATKHINKELS